jgi:hypothetical protein
MMRSYIILGSGLVLAGIAIALFSYIVIDSTPLTAIGLSTMILGLISIGLAYSRPKLSPEICMLINKTGVKNTLAILEEFEVSNTAIYLPRNMMNEHAKALILLDREYIADKKNIEEKLSDIFSARYEFSIPLHNSDSPQRFKEISHNLIIKYGNGPRDMAIAVTTMGNISLDFLKRKPEPTETDIQSAISYILTGILDIAKGVKVHFIDTKIKVTVSGIEKMNKEIFQEKTLYSQILGSPVASIAAAVCSEALGKPVRITYDTSLITTFSVALEVLS